MARPYTVHPASAESFVCLHLPKEMAAGGGGVGWDGRGGVRWVGWGGVGGVGAVGGCRTGSVNSALSLWVEQPADLELG